MKGKGKGKGIKGKGKGKVQETSNPDPPPQAALEQNAGTPALQLQEPRRALDFGAAEDSDSDESVIVPKPRRKKLQPVVSDDEDNLVSIQAKRRSSSKIDTKLGPISKIYEKLFTLEDTSFIEEFSIDTI